MNVLGEYALRLHEAKAALLRETEAALKQEVLLVPGVKGVGQVVSEVAGGEITVALRFFTHRSMPLEVVERRFASGAVTKEYDLTDGIPDVGEYSIRALESPGVWGVAFCETLS